MRSFRFCTHGSSAWLLGSMALLCSGVIACSGSNFDSGGGGNDAGDATASSDVSLGDTGVTTGSDDASDSGGAPDTGMTGHHDASDDTLTEPDTSMTDGSTVDGTSADASDSGMVTTDTGVVGVDVITMPVDVGPEAPVDAGCRPGPDPTTGLFVDPNAGNDSNLGSQSAPVKTIGRALTLAKTLAPSMTITSIYLAPGSYAESVDVTPLAPHALYILGGWSVSGSGGSAVWSPVCDPALARKQAVIASPTNIGVLVESMPTPLTLRDLSVTASDGANPGDSSYGVLARGGSQVNLTNVVVIAGNGQKGATGTPGPAPGVIACNGKTDCSDGAAGGATTNGSGGGPIGSFTASSYTPANGANGASGLGGHNGAQTTNSETCSDCSLVTGSGGFPACSVVPSGTATATNVCGCGGGGGGAGGGGTGGGGSFAVLAIGASTSVNVQISSLQSQDGGDGGAGISGGPGGSGTTGTKGTATCVTGYKTCVQDLISASCNSSGPISKTVEAPATTGGTGGSGGAGGGGGGGPSVVLLSAGGGAFSVDMASTLSPGSGGAGGGSPVNAGFNGTSSATLKLP
jgi:hypothetical protein